MLEDTRKSIIIGSSILVGLIIAALLLYIFLFRGEPAPELPSVVQVTQPDEVVEVAEPEIQIFQAPAQDVVQDNSTEPSEEVQRRFTVQLSRIFVERFGTYSTQNDNRHIADVLPIVTDGMKEWLDTQSIEQSTQYSGATMRVIESGLESYSDTRAIVSIGAQQELSNGSLELNYLRGTVRLVKVGDEWKVDGLFWE